MSGGSRHIHHKHRGLGQRQPAVVAGGPALVGGVAVDDGLTVSDMAVRVGGAVAVGVRQQDVIVLRDSAREREGKFIFKIILREKQKLKIYISWTQTSRIYHDTGRRRHDTFGFFIK